MQQRKFDEIIIVVFSLFVHRGRSFSFCTKREHEAKTSSRGRRRRGNRNTTSLRGILSQTASLQKLRAQRTRTTKALCGFVALSDAITQPAKHLLHLFIYPFAILFCRVLSTLAIFKTCRRWFVLCKDYRSGNISDWLEIQKGIKSGLGFQVWHHLVEEWSCSFSFEMFHSDSFFFLSAGSTTRSNLAELSGQRQNCWNLIHNWYIT